ncbi:MAG: L,D-transpeptidase, partial [Akkermansia sp.]|nr:L,D-transpeptidase [Akkermansia sp.]
MKPGILALASISSILVSCNPYGRPPLFDKIAGKIQGASSQDSYLSGVGATSGVNTDLPPEARLGQGYWDLPSGIQGEKHIIIDLKQQKVFYYVGATLVGVSPMSSGKEGFGTPRGTYKIIQKDANYKSGTYGVLRSKSTGAVVNGDYNARAGGAPAGTYFDPAPMP